MERKRSSNSCSPSPSTSRSPVPSASPITRRRSRSAGRTCAIAARLSRSRLSPMGDSLGVYLLRRFFLAVPILVGISLVTYVLLGAWLNPFWQALGPTQCQIGSQARGACSKEIQAAIAHYHLNAHLIPRWWYWVEGVFTGQSNKPITSASRFAKPIWPQVASATAHTTILIAFSLL